MSCGILAQSCYVKLSSKCNAVSSLLAIMDSTKWPSHVDVAGTATTGAVTSSKYALCSTASDGSVDDIIQSQLLPFYNSYPAWQTEGSLGIIRSAPHHHYLQQTAWPHHRNSRCYCTGPRGDGFGSTTSTTQAAGAENSTTQAAGAGNSTAQVQLSQKEKLKRAVKEYGSTVIVFHITISLASLAGFYLAVSSGIDMVGMLKSIGVGESILQSRLATGTGTFVVAYAVHKVFAPVRIGITLTSTPLIVRYLRSKGVLKPPKAKA